MEPVEIISRETWEKGIRDDIKYTTGRCLTLLRHMKSARINSPIVDQALLDTCIKEINMLEARVEVQ